MSGKKNDKTAEKTQRTHLKALFGWRSVIIGLIGIFVLKIAVSTDPGYNFVCHRLLFSNWEFIQEHKNLSYDQKLISKLGFSYVYVDHLKKNTPESAVILFPKKEYIRQKGSQEIRDEITNKVWLASFLYPRKTVFEDERETNPLFKQANYAAIINTQGYNLLEYDVEQKIEYALLPIKQGSLTQNSQN